MLSFEWDCEKARLNREKHGVSFEEARSIFHDQQALQFHDDGYYETEERYVMLGLSANLRLLVVAHCERANGEVIRIISARKATSKERKYYAGDYV